MHSKVCQKFIRENILKLSQNIFSCILWTGTRMPCLIIPHTEFCKGSSYGFFLPWVLCILWLPQELVAVPRVYVWLVVKMLWKEKAVSQAFGAPTKSNNMSEALSKFFWINELFKKLVGMCIHDAPVTQDSQWGIRLGENQSYSLLNTLWEWELFISFLR